MPFTAQLGTTNSTLGNIALGFGSSTAPIYTFEVTGSPLSLALAASMTFVAPIYSANITGTPLTPVLVASMTFTSPVYSATVSGSPLTLTLHADMLALFNAVQAMRLFSEPYSGGY